MFIVLLYYIIIKKRILYFNLFSVQFFYIRCYKLIYFLLKETNETKKIENSKKKPISVDMYRNLKIPCLYKILNFILFTPN